jgi:hypothetical protein
MNDTIRQYMAEIGRKGGRSGKGTVWRKEVCRHAAIVRWRAYRAQQKAEARKREEPDPAEQIESEKEPVANEAVMHNIDS